jgi:uncharacterized RDD family membrane protein YckC
MSRSYAGMWKRFAAYFLDAIVQIILIGGIAFIFDSQGIERYLIAGCFLFAISWIYFAGMESSKLQATLGKLILGMRVVDLEGKRISFFRATWRYFAKLLSRILLGFGYLMIAFTQKKQGLHDKLAATVVVNKKM